MSNKVSIVLVNYNGMLHIQTCLNSLIKQMYTDYEIIFVDNSSTDGSLEYAQTKYPIRFIKNNTNLGYAGAIFSALPHTTGDYITPLNIDTEVDSEWLSYMVKFLNSNPEAGAVTPKILLFDTRNKINTKGLNIHISGLGFCRQLNKPDYDSINPERVSGFSGCSYIIRREILEKLQGLPDDCFMANDDVIISWLLHLMGYKIYCIPQSVIYHKYHPDLTPEKMYRLEKNRLSLLLYALKPFTLVLCIPLYFIIELMILAYCLLKGDKYLRAKLSTYSAIFRERNIIKNTRQQYQPLRKVSDHVLFSSLKWNLDWKQLFNI